MTDKQPEALRLAYELDKHVFYGDQRILNWKRHSPLAMDAAAELRRLHEENEILRTRLAQPEPAKLWLWKNFVDGKPEYWAFDNPYPTNLEDGDPQTLGQPCGYAIFKPSRDGSNGRTEEQVLREMASVKLKPQLEPKPVAWLVENKQNPTRRYVYTAEQLQELGYGNISTEPFNILAPLYTAPPQREWQGLTDEEMEAVANSVEYNPLAMTVYEYRVAVQKATAAKLKEKNT